jgi:hypothetical protein
LDSKRAEQFLPRSGGGKGKRGVVAQTIYIHVSKCKNNKNKKTKKPKQMNVTKRVNKAGEFIEIEKCKVGEFSPQIWGGQERVPPCF